ncbi:MAG: COG1361 S-layer family protein [Candidatus Nitrosocosmicus sp.]
MELKKILHKKKTTHVFTLIMLILFSSFSLYGSNYFVHGQFLSTADARNPLFLDSYWTETPSTNSSPLDLTTPNRIEVGPGEGPSTLAVVIVNTGRSDITGVKGYLALTDQFRSIPGQNGVNTSNVSVASYNAIVKPGESFPLYFPVNVLRNATVGPYSSSLDLVYSKVQEVGQITTTMEIPFRITGKVILDATSLTQNLTTGTLNKAVIAIKNKGSADANGVIATITNLNGNTVTNLGDSSTGNQNNRSGNSTDNSTSTKSATQTVSQDSNEINQTISNIATLEANTFDIGKIRSNELIQIKPLLYADYNAGGTIQSMNLEVSYNDAYGNKKSSNTVIGLVISPNPPESTLSVLPDKSNFVKKDHDSSQISKSNDSSIIIRSGKIEKMDFVVNNTGGKSLNDVLLSLASSSDSVKILGDSRWAIPVFSPYEEKKLSTTVYAADDVISKPVSFTVDANYISGGKTRSDSMSLGAYIEGQIKVTAYDVAINEIGGAPNLVGNLLNEGNTMAFFTRIQVVESDSDNGSLTPIKNSSTSTVNNSTSSAHNLFLNIPPSQYLGDLTENSPLPFGIPINITTNAPKGDYPISLVITYKDNLRNDHKLILNETVTYKPRIQDSSDSSNGIFGLPNNMILIVTMVIIIIIIVVITVIFIRRRRRRKQLSSMSNEESNITEDSDNPAKDDINSTLFDNDDEEK